MNETNSTDRSATRKTPLKMKRTLFLFKNQSDLVIYIDIEPWSFGYALESQDVLEIDFSGHSNICPEDLSDIVEFSFHEV